MLRGKELREEAEWDRVQWQTAHILGTVSEKAQRSMLNKLKATQERRELSRKPIR